LLILEQENMSEENWFKRNWKKLLIVGLIVGAIAAVLVYVFVLSGNADRTSQESTVKAGDISELNGIYKSVKDSKRAEIYFIAKATKEARGNFKDFSAELTINGSLESAKLVVKISPKSIFTDNDLRDKHLKEGDFFDVETYPELTFISNKIEKEGDDYRASGVLNFLGKDWDFSFPFIYRGLGEENGKTFASFKGAFTFDHTKHGMKKSGDAKNVSVEFYVDMMLETSDSSNENDTFDDDMSDDDFDFDEDEDDSSEEIDMPERTYDDLLDKVEAEAEVL